MIESILMGLAVGGVGGVPVGPMGALALEQGLEKRVPAALGTGLGAALGMGGWAYVAVVLLDRAGPFITRFQGPLQAFVAVLFLVLGASAALALRREKPRATGARGFLAALGNASLIAALRPTTALIVAGLVTSLFPGRTVVEAAAAFAAGAFATNFAWFGVVALVAAFLRAKLRPRAVFVLRAALAGIIAAFGGGLLARALWASA